MHSMQLKKGYSLNIKGKPALETENLPVPKHVAVLPEHIAFIKPRLRVKPGQAVRLGSVLFEDKRNPAVVFLSPGAGRVADIHFGPRRVIKEIVIRLDENEAVEEFTALGDAEIETMPRQKLIAAVMAGGLWPLIRELPFRDIARPDFQPPALYVCAGSTEPFHPSPEVYLKGKNALFEYGLRILRKLAGSNIFLSVHRDDAFMLKDFNSLVTHVYCGHYPAHDPGLMLYRTKKSAHENRAWYLNAQDVLLLAQLLKTGKYPTERTVILAGSRAKDGKHFKTRMGAPLGHIARNCMESTDTRWVVGGIFTGYAGSPKSYLGFYETALMLVPSGMQREFMALMKPGYDKASYHRTFLSCFNKAEFEVDCNKHGEVRACVACGACNTVCPVDILVQMCFKAILAGEVEESLAHGLLDCVECGLCSFVCPSKIELFETLKQAKAAYHKEMAG